MSEIHTHDNHYLLHQHIEFIHIYCAIGVMLASKLDYY